MPMMKKMSKKRFKRFIIAGLIGVFIFILVLWLVLLSPYNDSEFWNI